MLVLKLIGSVVAQLAIFGGFLFIPAGTLRWWRAWVFLGVVFVASVATMIGVFRQNEALLDERFKPPVQAGQPLADKIVTLLFLLTFLGELVFIPLDVFRFHWIGEPGAVVAFLGLIAFAAGWGIMALALKENTFAAPVVKHQQERRHSVTESGVYGVIRHPMYAGGMLLIAGMPLWLESSAAALLASLPIATLVARLLIEERFLKRELTGYGAYMERIRYRLIPFLW